MDRTPITVLMLNGPAEGQLMAIDPWVRDIRVATTDDLKEWPYKVLEYAMRGKVYYVGVCSASPILGDDAIPRALVKAGLLAEPRISPAPPTMF